jgi:hypothetical protein
MPGWSKVLAENTDKPYKSFLLFLLDKNYYNDREERLMIKQIAADYGSDTSKISKWLKQIYEDIIELNFDKPELFKTEGVVLKYLLNTTYNFTSFSFLLVFFEPFASINHLHQLKEIYTYQTEHLR